MSDRISLDDKTAEAVSIFLYLGQIIDISCNKETYEIRKKYLWTNERCF